MPQRPARSARRTPAAPARPAPPPEQVPGTDIIVIASKTDTPLATFPGQVAMVRGSDLEIGGPGGTERIMQRVPTLSSTYLGSGRNKLFIRGIADSSFTGPTQATVGQYLGDLRLAYNAPDPDLRLADLERVEVLEGPQGTLYGAGSIGGIVRLVPRDPVFGLAAMAAKVGASATQHGAVGADASATINLPVAGDSVALRASFHGETQGGYIDKPLLGREDVNRTGVLGGRAALRFSLAPDWHLDLGAVGQKTDGRDSQYADRDGRPLERASLVEEGFAADFGQVQAAIEGRLGEVRIRSTTGVTGQELEERYDATPAGGEPRLFVQRNDTGMVANETRAWQPLGDRAGWLIGTSYTYNRNRMTRALGRPDQPGAVTGVTNVLREFTTYGEGSLRIGEGLIATLGARYTRSRLSGEAEDISPTLSPSLLAALAAITAVRVEESFLPAASIAASLGDGSLLYVRYQEGFRPGGLAVASDFVTAFRNDRIASFEVGGRHGRAGSGPFDLAASIAHTRWSDIQADFIDNGGFASTANVGDGRIWTATVTGGVRLAEGLRLDAGFTYNDSKVDEFTPALTQRITRVPNIAKVAGRIGIDLARELRPGLELTGNAWAQYVGKSRLGIGPELGDLQGDYLDTGMHLRLGHEGLGVTLSLTNLADVEGNRFALGTPFATGRDQVTPLRPRTVRIGIDASF